MEGYEGKWRGCIESDWMNKVEQDPNDLFVLIIVLYGVNTLVFVLLYMSTMCT